MSIAELLGHEDETIKKYGEILQELETELKAGNLSEEEAVEILEDMKVTGELIENNNSMENAALVRSAIDVLLKLI
ncbi:hypothetical protein OAS42_00905 [bacterium]|jgi:hypothetical protein|nr:hypothetical protein [bacterium]|tara:strand:- start:681 stop:908 length:228 start_codon:yes stop_codon:yes gene_type:complete